MVPACLVLCYKRQDRLNLFQVSMLLRRLLLLFSLSWMVMVVPQLLLLLLLMVPNQVTLKWKLAQL